MKKFRWLAKSNKKYFYVLISPDRFGQGNFSKSEIIVYVDVLRTIILYINYYSPISYSRIRVRPRGMASSSIILSFLNLWLSFFGQRLMNVSGISSGLLKCTHLQKQDDLLPVEMLNPNIDLQMHEQWRSDRY